jgi:hypothetical protein
MLIKYPLIVLALLITLTHSSQDVPIQAGGYGFSVGDNLGTLHIQFFIDFQCTHYPILGPDSKNSYNTWSIVRKTISLLDYRVKLTYQFIPLPFHFYAIYIHQAFFYVLKKVGGSAG